MNAHGNAHVQSKENGRKRERESIIRSIRENATIEVKVKVKI